MSVDDLTCDVEPEAQAVGRSMLTAGIVYSSTEGVEQRRDHRGGDRRPIIVDGHEDAVSGVAPSYTDRTLAVRDRVAHEIREHLLDSIWIPLSS